MPTIQDYITSFVQMYNSYPIRKQVQREWYLPAGKPNVMYNYPSKGIQDYARAPNPSILKLVESQLS